MVVKIVLALLAVVLIIFVSIQFVPVQRTNPPVAAPINWDSAQTQALAERACMDCHSNQTKWPWYANVAPVSWLVAHDVEEGRSQLNFSQLGADQNQLSRVAQRVQRAIQSGQMPFAPYLIMHPGAKLTAGEKQALIAGLTKTFSQTR